MNDFFKSTPFLDKDFFYPFGSQWGKEEEKRYEWNWPMCQIPSSVVRKRKTMREREWVTERERKKELCAWLFKTELKVFSAVERENWFPVLSLLLLDLVRRISRNFLFRIGSTKRTKQLQLDTATHEKSNWLHFSKINWSVWECFFLVTDGV